MKIIDFYHVDTFTNKTFTGNPAGVCKLDDWLDKTIMQSIAFENNLSETAFYIKKEHCFEIRWFTPTTEVDLCGHATLASAFVEFLIYNNMSKELIFSSNSGNLYVKKENNLIQLNFPTDDFIPVSLSRELTIPFKEKAIEAYRGKDDIMLVFDSEESVKNMSPDLALVSQIKARGVIVTASATEFDFVSRFFAPQSGIPEDPVTGSAHTMLVPYWAQKLSKQTMMARQHSSRGGTLYCSYNDQRVKISGEAVLYKKGEILLTE